MENKIGVLTFHNNRNKGAILQAYALVQTLDEVIPSSTVEIVDYRTMSKEIDRLASSFTKSSGLSGLKDEFRSERFIRSELPLSDQRMTTNSYSKSIEYIKKQNYDTIVVGSDEVWKVRPGSRGIIRSRSFERPFPNAYFLDENLDVNKVSYAASANTTNPENLSEGTVNKIASKLKSFDLISVRDSYTKDLLDSMGIANIHQVPDPTLLVEFKDIDLRDKLSQLGVQIDKPLLGIHAAGHPFFKGLCKQYHNKNYQIISPTYCDYADINLESKLDPFEYVNLYKYFDMVVTTSLHSTIFSIKNQTPFVTIDTDNRYKNVDSKTRSLLDDFSLLDRHFKYDSVKEGNISHKDITQLEEELDQTIIKESTQSLRKSGSTFMDRIRETHEN